jgi:hypothetical protein
MPALELVSRTDFYLVLESFKFCFCSPHSDLESCLSCTNTVDNHLHCSPMLWSSLKKIPSIKFSGSGTES